MTGDPALHDALIERMGEDRFLYAKQWIERRFCALRAEKLRGVPRPGPLGSAATASRE